MTQRLFLIYRKGFDVKIGWKVSKTKCLRNVTKLELLILMFLLGRSTFTPVRRLYYRKFSNWSYQDIEHYVTRKKLPKFFLDITQKLRSTLFMILSWKLNPELIICSITVSVGTWNRKIFKLKFGLALLIRHSKNTKSKISKVFY